MKRDEILKLANEYTKLFSVDDEALHYNGKPPETQNEGLIISIAKWMLVSRPGFGSRSGGGPNTCGLCMLNFNEGCRKCIIRNDTGYSGCSFTPYDERVREDRYDFNVQTSIAYARAELEYLIGLARGMKLVTRDAKLSRILNKI